MNVQIQHVITDITGVTGLAIVDAILGGDRDPATLAKLRDRRIQASEETIRKSLEGNWRQEHLVTLRQSRDSFRHYQKQILGCDEEIEKLLLAFSPRVDPAERPLPANRKRTRKERTVNPRTGLDLRTASYKLFGVELTGSWADGAGAGVVQRSWQGHVALGHGRAFCVLAGAMSGQ